MRFMMLMIPKGYEKAEPGAVPDAKPPDCLAALDAAQRAFAGWAATPARGRAQVLRRAADRLLTEVEAIALTLSLESGKPLAEAREEVTFAAEYLEWNAEEAVRISGRLEAHPEGDCDFVVGSKAMKGASDHRPLFRRAATRVINGMLRAALDFRGTDTHGLKAFHRETVLPIVRACVIDRDLFTSELVIRAGRAGLRVVEIPIRLAEKRPPTINLVKRVHGCSPDWPA